MAIGVTRTWAVDEVLSAGNLRMFVNVPINDEAGRNGVVEQEDSLAVLDGPDGDRYMLLPKGTTGQRPPTPQAGMMRFGTTTGRVEIHDGTGWRTILDSNSITYSLLNGLGLVGTGSSQVAQGNHTH